jgi:hypothetical protein
MKRIVLIFLASLTILRLGAQTDQNVDRGNIIEQRIEQIAEAAEDEDLDYTTLFEQLTIYLDFPLNLNKATVDDLYGLGLLTNEQILSFLDYRKKYGDLFSLYELPLIDGWEQATAELILPFVTVIPDAERDKITLKRLSKYGKNEFVLRWQRILEDQLGYAPVTEERLEENPNARYLGSPDKLYARYRYRYDDRISFGFTAEKDNGEEFFRGSQPNGFDFYSGHVYLKDFGKVKQLAIGDYQAQFGQGLTFWSGLGFNRKSSFTLSTAQAGRGLTPYTSINENLFLRGGAVTLGHGKFEFTAFYSGKRIDGNLAELEPDSVDLQEPEVLISSFQESGFHRTPAEIADKDAIFQEHYGGHLRFRTTNFQLGVTGAHMKLDGRIDRNTQTYSQFRFSGTENTTLGADYVWRLRNFLFFGETARSQNGGIATVNGVNIEMNPRLLVNITQRYYSRDFQGVASVGFGEGSLVENESGVYFGLEFRPFKRWKVNAFIDQFKFPWLRYQTDAPSAGYDFFAQLEYQASGRTNIYFRYRDRLRQIDTREEIEGADFLVDNPRKNLRLNFSHRVSSQVRLRSRIEWVSFQRGNEPVSEGFLMYQDVVWQLKKVPLSISARYALFDTDTYDARLYAYENDVLYFFSIPAYFGRGSRAYLLLKYDLGRNIDIWLRWAQSYFTDRQVIGSGLEEIQGNTRTEVKAQIRFKF